VSEVEISADRLRRRISRELCTSPLSRPPLSGRGRELLSRTALEVKRYRIAGWKGQAQSLVEHLIELGRRGLLFAPVRMSIIWTVIGAPLVHDIAPFKPRAATNGGVSLRSR